MFILTVRLRLPNTLERGEQMDCRPSTEEITQHLVFSRSLLQRNENAVEVEDESY
jgi:hypothetical protein